MKKLCLLVLSMVLYSVLLSGQVYTGNVFDKENSEPLENVIVKIAALNISDTTSEMGEFKISISDSLAHTISFELEGYMFEEIYNMYPQSDDEIFLRAKKKSSASIRWETYMESCENYNSPEVPQNSDWSVAFEEEDLTGDFAANSKYTRRDPSAVLKVGDKYYVWYTYCLSATSTYFSTSDLNDKVFPWDYCDVWYATSTDGYSWEEQGPAVERGEAGSFDDRSVFTPEIFEHEGMYYLVYQVVAHPYVERVKNNVAMAKSSSPDGPWGKLEAPILRPTNNGVWKEGSDSRLQVEKKGDFDSHKVHDPCLLYYKDKFYLYYKGERMGEERYCGEREIKWGVAIADNVEGPYVKSEYNPITNTGHEVSIWKYDEGIAIIQKLDGPERGTIQYAEDGVNFEIMGSASNVPDALGIFRPSTSGNDMHHGVSWGLCHVLRWDIIQGGWMYLKRFDINGNGLESLNIIQDTIYIQKGTSMQPSVKYLPINTVVQGVEWSVSNPEIANIDGQGNLRGLATGTTQLKVESADGAISDICLVIVIDQAIAANKITIQAETFISTGNEAGYEPGGYNGVNATGVGINYVNRQDWANYSVDVSVSGVYELRYQISTPSDDAEVELKMDNKVLARDEVFNNGAWDSYYELLSESLIRLPKGVHDIQVRASGTNDWQWNLDRFELTRVADFEPLTSTSISGHSSVNKLYVYPNPAKNDFQIRGIAKGQIEVFNKLGQLVLSSSLNENSLNSFSIAHLPSGFYLIQVVDGENIYTNTLIKH